MRRPPRSPTEPLLSRRVLALSVLQGAAVLAAVLAVYIAMPGHDVAKSPGRAAAFATLIFGNLGLILTNRSWSRTILGSFGRSNTALWLVVAGATATLALVLAVPVVRDLFQFGPLRLVDAVLGMAAGAASILWFELFKLRRLRPTP